MTGWSENFSYKYLKLLLETVKNNFIDVKFTEYTGLKKINKPMILLRHDVDVSLDHALNIAAIENNFGLKATYYIKVNSGLYDVFSKKNTAIIKNILDYNHDIGLHFVLCDKLRKESLSTAHISNMIDEDCFKLKQITKIPIKTISFHRPLSQFRDLPLFINNRIRAFSSELTEWYLSDSRCCWREGEPLPKFTPPFEKSMLQLLIHPIWWSEKHLSGPDRLQIFFLNKTIKLTDQQTLHFDQILSETIPSVKRTNAKII